MLLRKLLFTFCLSFIAMMSFAQPSASSSNDVAALAEKYVNAYVSQDIETLFDLTHPNIVSMGGGKKYVMDDLQRERSSMAVNFNFISGSVGDIATPVESEGEMQTIVPVNYVVEIKDAKYNLQTSLFAGSSDGGANWKFVYLDQYDRESLKIFVPNLSDAISLPERTGFEKIEK